MWLGIITLFPDKFAAVSREGVFGRAVASEIVSLEFFNPRDYTTDRHRTVDDRPYGGGAGMVMKVEPLQQAVAAAKERALVNTPVVLMSPQGQRFSQTQVSAYRHSAGLILVCGRYEGIDERVVESDIDEEWSIGDYVLSGGELPAMVLIDAAARLVPGVLGHQDSAIEDSFNDGLLDCPHYTRPEVIDGRQVPEVLLSGNHAAIKRWRLKQSLGRTWQRRPDLLAGRTLNAEQQVLLDEFIEEHALSATLGKAE